MALGLWIALAAFTVGMPQRPPWGCQRRWNRVGLAALGSAAGVWAWRGNAVAAGPVAGRPVSSRAPPPYAFAPLRPVPPNEAGGPKALFVSEGAGAEDDGTTSIGGSASP